jgi:hypothetical protein
MKCNTEIYIRYLIFYKISISFDAFFPSLRTFEDPLLKELHSGRPNTLMCSLLDVFIALVMVASHLVFYESKKVVMRGSGPECKGDGGELPIRIAEFPPRLNE